MTHHPWTSPHELRVACPPWLDAAIDWRAAYATDDDRMRLVVRLARRNVETDLNGPFAAAVFESATGTIVAAGVNSVLRLQNSVLHAEIMAFMLAHARVGSFTLDRPGEPSYELVSSCEPCAMCLGAVLWSGVRRLVYGASRADATAAGFDEGPVFPESRRYLRDRGIEIVPEVLRAEPAGVLVLYRRLGGPIYNAQFRDAPPL